MQLSVEDNIIRRNPFDFKLNMLTNNREKRKALSEEEEREFFSYLKEDDMYSDWYDIVIFLRLTGLRISEALGLTWTKDIDLQERKITVDHQLLQNSSGDLYISKPKTDSGIRTLYITNELMEVLVRLKKRKKTTMIVDGYGGFLFADRNGNPKHAIQVERIFRKIVKKYFEDTGKKIKLTPHVLRHTYFTRMAEKGLSPKALQYIMGHSNINETLNVYTHFGFENIKEEIKKIL